MPEPETNSQPRQSADLRTSSSPKELSKRTIAAYEGVAEAFWQGTRDHDVCQNYEALLGAITAPSPFTILDFGCGPGRDLHYFRSLGHTAIGLDGSAPFVEMARAYSGCDVLHQDFLELDLPARHFDGIFANAVLFHVPRNELSRVLIDLLTALKPGGVLFCSNPHGNNEETMSGERYCCFYDLKTWRCYMREAGYRELGHYYRPPGKPRSQQPWLATVWRNPND